MINFKSGDDLIKEYQRKLNDFSENYKNFLQALLKSVSFHELKENYSDSVFDLMSQHWLFFKSNKKNKFNINIKKIDIDLPEVHLEILYDDVPFILDSVRMLLQKRNLTISNIFSVKGMNVSRDTDGNFIEFKDKNHELIESSIVIKAHGFIDDEKIDYLKTDLLNLLESVYLVVNDFSEMKTFFTTLIEKIEENIDFLKWIVNEKFIFLGIDSAKIEDQSIDFKTVKGCPNLIKKTNQDLIKKIILSQKYCHLLKEKDESFIHRNAHYDVFYIRSGSIIYRIIGLFTSELYRDDVKTIPYLNEKINNVFQEVDIETHTYEGRILEQLISTINRQDLVYTDSSLFTKMMMEIYFIKERPVIKVIIVPDELKTFLVAYVFVPRDIFNSTLRNQCQNFLSEILNAKTFTFEPYFSESILARIRFEFRGDDLNFDYDSSQIENKIKEIAHGWLDQFYQSLINSYGIDEGKIYFRQYSSIFSANYKDFYRPKQAAADVKLMNILSKENPISLKIFKTKSSAQSQIRLKIFQLNQSLTLSDVLPILENFGFYIEKDRLFELTADNNKIWINDFLMQISSYDENNAENIFTEVTETFKNILQKKNENDKFNQLIISAELNRHQVRVLRALSKYIWQIGSAYSQSYVEDVCNQSPDLIKDLIFYFEVTFNPDLISDQRQLKLSILEHKINSNLDALTNLDADKILRRLFNVIQSIVRTNYFQRQSDNSKKSYVSFKFNPQKIEKMPLPVMKHEIFVHGYFVEGVHLRSSDIARGGLRWSDRFDDYRKEVLGLVKAQQVKNSIIVPAGAKGGFILKNQPAAQSREDYLQSGINAYKTFIRGLLDLTDNLKDNQIIKPMDTICLDQDDPYFVVAADKGTATFSDIANSIAQEYDYWLSDAFASGGSLGYDHKGIGITARGAFESVQNHLSDIGIDMNTTPFSCIGIGDMSGDVFGNGALCAQTMLLKGAFNHLDIFIDPNPDLKASYEERSRLFKIGRGSWSDYNSSLISQGGGVFSRKLKSISLTPEMKEMLRSEKDKMSPNELIHSLLQCEVDVIFNGGIGTYVKASFETDAEAADKQNDALRINADMLKAKIFVEGGNLGVTQRARIEFSKLGGIINTDTLDNSGGVDCSDHEVNLKILLDYLVQQGLYDQNDRNSLLKEMTEEVAQLVLKNNRDQNKVISISEFIAARDLSLHDQVIRELSKSGLLDRDLEFLPTKKEIESRKLMNKGLTRPELIVLLSYVKMELKWELSKQKIIEYPLIQQQLLREFPSKLIDSVKDNIYKHPLNNQITATMLANLIVNEMGIGFISRIKNETKANSLQITHAYLMVRDLFNSDLRRALIKGLPASVSKEYRFDLLLELSRLLYRATKWMLAHPKMMELFYHEVDFIKEVINKFQKTIKHNVLLESKKSFSIIKNYLNSDELTEVLVLTELLPALNLYVLSKDLSLKLEALLPIYSEFGKILNLTQIKLIIDTLSVNSQWDALARGNLRDDIDRYQTNLTRKFFNNKNTTSIQDWIKQHQETFNSWTELLNDFETQEKTLISCSVLIRFLESFLES